jgi:hypothetical protein
MAEATLFTTTRAPTAWPEDVVVLAEPKPPFRFAVVAPYPPPDVPRSKSRLARRAASYPSSR